MLAGCAFSILYMTQQPSLDTDPPSLTYWHPQVGRCEVPVQQFRRCRTVAQILEYLIGYRLISHLAMGKGISIIIRVLPCLVFELQNCHAQTCQRQGRTNSERPKTPSTHYSVTEISRETQVWQEKN